MKLMISSRILTAGFLAALSTLVLGAFSGCEKQGVTATIADTDWVLTELMGATVDADQVEGLDQPTLRLDSAAGQAQGTSGLNRYFSTYSLEGPYLSFGPVAGTRMAGPEQAMMVEDAFMRMLSQVTGWSLENGQLQLTAEGALLASFTAVAVP